MLALSYALWFCSIAVLALTGYQRLQVRVQAYLKLRTEEARMQLEDMFVYTSQGRLIILYLLVPPALGIFAWLATGWWWCGVFGVAAGAVMPKMLLRFAHAARRRKFEAQLVDTLLLVTSSLRAGLSLLQSFTVATEEMPPPVNQEFGLLLKETRMGVNLEEALTHLSQRMPSDDMNLFVTAVLVARETGGDLTMIFSRLVETIRERKKIKEKIKTLTFMARAQGILMVLLPIVFMGVTYTANHDNFKFFMDDPMGRLMLAGVLAIQIFSAVLFARFSRSPL